MEKPSRPKVGPLEYFMHAKRFMLADHHLRECKHNNPKEATAWAALVLSAFTTELLLKTIHMIDNGAAPKGHNLSNLYRNLPNQRRKAIERLWNSHVNSPKEKKIRDAMERVSGGRPPDNFEEALKGGARAFEELRYPGEGFETNLSIGALPYILQDVIYDINPDWRSVRHAPPTLLADLGQELDGAILTRSGNQ